MALTKSFVPPLFDRLKLEGCEPLDTKGMRRSVARDLSLLFNSRAPAQPQDDDDLLATYPPFFGVPDFSAPVFQNPAYLKKVICQCVERYEPRVKSCEVLSIEHNKKDRTLSIVLAGDVFLGEQRIKMTFPIQVQDV